MQRKLKATKRTGKRIRLVVFIAFLCILAALIYIHLNSPNFEERIAALDAARTIPDSQNAAVIYNQLLAEPNATSLGALPEFLDIKSDGLTLLNPWLEKDYPKVTAWIEEYQWLIDKLIEASQFEKCRFPIVADWYSNTRSTQLNIVRRWAFLIKRACNNDIAEGRNEDAIAKCKCLILMGDHYRQQSTTIEYLFGTAIESLGVHRIAVLIMEGRIDESHLKEIELIPLRTQDDWPSVIDRIKPVQDLVDKKWKEQLSLLGRLKYDFQYWLFGNMKNNIYEKMHFIHNRVLTSSRGIRILIALKRYKNKYSRWPEDLDEIKSMVDEYILVDPLNNGTFVYVLTDNGFTLYSKGQNNIDEGGRYTSNGQEDWLIWPPHNKISKPKQKDTDPNQSGTNAEVVK